MTELLNPIAELDQPDSGVIVTPSEAYMLRKERKFYCPDHDCKDPERVLISAKSKLDNYQTLVTIFIQRPYFIDWL